MLVDSLGDHEDMPEWSEAADELLGAGLTLNPAELHGAITGLLGAGVVLSDETGQDRVVALVEKSLAVDVHGGLVDFLHRLVSATRSTILDTDYGFQPLLPDDDETLEVRLVSIGRWVQGFLSGFTQAISVAQAGDEPIASGTADVLRDFAAIAQVDHEQEFSEEAERELEELIEYARVAAISVVHDAQHDI